MYHKKFVHDKWAILGPKIAHPDNSGPALRIFFTFCRMKGGNRYMKSCLYKLVVFQEKKFIWGNFIFLAFRSFFTVWLGMVRLSQVTVNWILKQSGLIFFMITTGSLNSQDMISFMITTGSLNSQGMIRILKQWRHDFSGKHLCDGYCMDIMWCLCVEVKIHGFVKLL